MMLRCSIFRSRGLSHHRQVQRWTTRAYFSTTWNPRVVQSTEVAKEQQADDNVWKSREALEADVRSIKKVDEASSSPGFHTISITNDTNRGDEEERQVRGIGIPFSQASYQSELLEIEKNKSSSVSIAKATANSKHRRSDRLGSDLTKAVAGLGQTQGLSAESSKAGKASDPLSKGHFDADEAINKDDATDIVLRLPPLTKPPKTSKTPTETDSSRVKRGLAKTTKKGAIKPVAEKSLSAETIELIAIESKQPEVKKLSYGLERILFKQGVYHLQDPRTGVYNFDHYLQDIMPAEEFDFESLGRFVPSSQDVVLQEIAKATGKLYVGSTSSMTSALAHFHFLLSRFRSLNLADISSGYPQSGALTRFTTFTRLATSVFLKYKDGVYACDTDADAKFDTGTVLSLLGQSMEKLLTLPKEEYEKYRKSSPGKVPDEVKNAPEAYHHSSIGNFVCRSQLDGHHEWLPGGGIFDIKTRACITVRHNPDEYKEMSKYQISNLHGQWHSFEREYVDMMRTTMLKYSLQVRMGRMDGIFIAYHNTGQIFGFQYVPLSEMDLVLHGQKDLALGDQEFKLSVQMLSDIFDLVTEKHPQRSIRFFFETRDRGEAEPEMYVFAEVMDSDTMETIQRAETEQGREEMLAEIRGEPSKDPISVDEQDSNHEPGTVGSQLQSQRELEKSQSESGEAVTHKDVDVQDLNSKTDAGIEGAAVLPCENDENSDTKVNAIPVAPKDQFDADGDHTLVPSIEDQNKSIGLEENRNMRSEWIFQSKNVKSSMADRYPLAAQIFHPDKVSANALISIVASESLYQGAIEDMKLRPERTPSLPELRTFLTSEARVSDDPTDLVAVKLQILVEEFWEDPVVGHGIRTIVDVLRRHNRNRTGRTECPISDQFALGTRLWMGHGPDHAKVSDAILQTQDHQDLTEANIKWLRISTFHPYAMESISSPNHKTIDHRAARRSLLTHAALQFRLAVLDLPDLYGSLEPKEPAGKPHQITHGKVTKNNRTNITHLLGFSVKVSHSVNGTPTRQVTDINYISEWPLPQSRQTVGTASQPPTVNNKWTMKYEIEQMSETSATTKLEQLKERKRKKIEELRGSDIDGRRKVFLDELRRRSKAAKKTTFEGEIKEIVSTAITKGDD